MKIFAALAIVGGAGARFLQTSVDQCAIDDLNWEASFSGDKLDESYCRGVEAEVIELTKETAGTTGHQLCRQACCEDPSCILYQVRQKDANNHKLFAGEWVYCWLGKVDTTGTPAFACNYKAPIILFDKRKWDGGFLKSRHQVRSAKVLLPPEDLEDAVQVGPITVPESEAVPEASSTASDASEAREASETIAAGANEAGASEAGASDAGASDAAVPIFERAEGRVEVAPRTLEEASFIPDMICGSSKIKEALRQGARNVRWQQIISTADTYLARQDLEISSTQTQIAALKDDLSRALASQQVKELSADKDKLTSLMQPVFAVFDSLEVMREAKCGAKRVKGKRYTRLLTPAADAFEAALAAELQPFLSFKMLHAESTTATCIDIIGLAGDPEASDCDRLCEEIATRARTLTSTFSTAVPQAGIERPEDIQAILDPMASTLVSQVGLRSDCAAAKGNLEHFGAEMDELDRHVMELRSVSVAAGSQLNDATFELEDLQEDAAKHGEKLAKLRELLKDANLGVEHVSGELDTLQAQSHSVQANLASSAAKLSKVQKEINDAQQASLVTQEFRAAVTNLLLQMVLSFDQAVRRPLAAVGLGSGVVVAERFPPVGTQVNCESALKELRGFCDEPETIAALRKANEATKSLLDADFAQVCDFGDVASTTKSISDIVQQRANRVVQKLKDAQSWLDETKGTKDATEQEANGEIEGLRKVISIYAGAPSDFYTGYLKKWKLGKAFSLLYTALADALAKSRATEQQLVEESVVLQGQLKSLMEQIEATRAKLGEVLEAARKLGKDVKEAEQLAEELRLAEQEMQASVERLAGLNAETSKALQEAESIMTETYSKATAFLQLLREHESE